MRNDICSIIQDVGFKPEDVAAVAAKNSNHPRYNTPISSVVLSTAEGRPQGTTWVFQDGSQVLSSEATADSGPMEVDDVMAEFDAFSKQTGGEHHERNASAASTPQGTTNNSDNNNSSSTHMEYNHNAAEDDMDDFLNEFEATTQGEHFRRDNPI